MRGAADSTEGYAAIQRDLHMLERWADGNLLKFNKQKCKVLHQARNVCRHQYMLGSTQLESSSTGKDLGVLADTKLNMNQQYDLATKKSLAVFFAALGKYHQRGDPTTLLSIGEAVSGVVSISQLSSKRETLTYQKDTNLGHQLKTPA